MKARVLKRDELFWFGEVYDDWPILGKCWITVTSPCYTRWGATLALKHWVYEHKAYEIKID